MSLWDQLRWSWRHSRRQLLETILVVLVIALGTATIVTVLTLFVSVGQQQKEAEKQDHFRTLQVLGRLESSSRQNLPLVLIGEELRQPRWEASLADLAGLQANLPAYMHVFVETSWPVNTSLLPEETEAPVGEHPGFRWLEGPRIFLAGTTERYFHFREFSLLAGNWFLPADLENQSRVIVLTQGLAASLFGDQNPIGSVVPVSMYGDEYIDYTVIGVLAAEGEEDFLSLRQSRTGYIPVSAPPDGRGQGRRSTFNSLFIGIDAGRDLSRAHELAAGEIKLLWGNRAVVESPLLEFREAQKTLRRYALLIGIFASVGLIIAVINILNLMLARVLKRTKSTGLAMALGSSRAQIFRQFLLEALSMGLAGSILGIFISFGLASLLQKGLGPLFEGAMYGTRVFFGMGLGLLTSLLFGVYPAYQGSRIAPVDALRFD